MSSASDILLERVKRATAGDYAIAGELGRGGMAAVYLARDISLNRQVAIKVMLPDLDDVTEIQERFLIEAQATAHLDHPGIVTVYSVKEREGLLFIVMKYIDGRTLERILMEESVLEVPVICAIIGQVAEVLHFAHGEGVVHRDVKPSNILLDSRGRPYVTDFGIAKVNSAKAITITGTMIGTPTFMSPEQCRGLPATAASDQYSLGVTAYQMLTRRLPFEGTLFELIHAHSYEPPPLPSALNPELAPALEECLLRMLAKNPQERWPSLVEVSHSFSEQAGRGQHVSVMRGKIAALAREAAQSLSPPKDWAASGDALAAGGSEPTTTPQPALVITPSEPSVEIGETLQLRLSESSGASLAGLRIEWRSEDATIATVDDDGRVSGRGVGLAKISASAGTVLGRATVTVRAAMVDTLVVTPQSSELDPDHDLQFVATALDARGNVLRGQVIVWASSDVGICAISQQGRAISIAPGRATVTAHCGDVKGSAAVKVRPLTVARVVVQPGDLSIEVEETRHLSAMVFGMFDRKLNERHVTWRSSVPAVVRVSGEGVVEGIAPGSAAVIATCEGKEGLASISIRNQPVVAVRVQPARLDLEVGRSIKLQGVAEDRRGRPVTEHALEWQSDDDRVALVDADGKVYAVSTGRTNVRASVGSVTSAIEVVAVPRPVSQIRIDSHEPTLTVGDRMQLEAVLLDADGGTLSGRTLSWASSDPDVIAVDERGGCEVKRTGSVRVTASSEGALATTKLRVVAAAPTQVNISSGRTLAEDAHEEPMPSRSQRARLAGRSRRVIVATASAGVLVAVVGWLWLNRRAATPTVTAIFQVDSMPAASGVAAARLPLDSVPRDTGKGRATPTTRARETAKQTPVAPAGDPAAAAPGAGAARGGDTAVRPTGGTTEQIGGRGAAADMRAAAPPVVTDLPPSPSPARPSPSSVSPNAPPQGATAPERSNEAERMLRCGNAGTASTALNDQLREDPARNLLALYQPTGVADRNSRASLDALLKGAERIRASAHSLRNDTAGDDCSWLMALDLTWTNAFGQPRQRSLQIRLEFDVASGTPRVKRVFALTGL